MVSNAYCPGYQRQGACYGSSAQLHVLYNVICHVTAMRATANGSAGNGNGKSEGRGGIAVERMRGSGTFASILIYMRLQYKEHYHHRMCHALPLRNFKDQKLRGYGYLTKRFLVSEAALPWLSLRVCSFVTSLRSSGSAENGSGNIAGREVSGKSWTRTIQIGAAGIWTCREVRLPKVNHSRTYIESEI